MTDEKNLQALYVDELDARYEAAERRLVERMQVPDSLSLLSEEDILAEANRLTRHDRFIVQSGEISIKPLAD